MKNLNLQHLLLIVTVIAGLVLGAGCGSSQLSEGLSVEQRFEAGKAKFDDGDYLEAIAEFEIVKVQFPGSNYADDAQFYLGECHYEREEFLLAAEEYLTLRRNMPSSPLDTISQLKIALCYYNLSPPYRLDQRYTNRAIDEFQTFIEYFPTHARAREAAEKIQELNSRKAKKDFESAVLYMKMEYYKAATVYYSSVIDRYYDTEFAEPALEGRIRAYVARKKTADALADIDRYLEKYPSGTYRSQLQSLRNELGSPAPVAGMKSDHK
jgi:outer membrane protein assembly factor BamD